jgi:hypothetical protein
MQATSSCQHVHLTRTNANHATQLAQSKTNDLATPDRSDHQLNDKANHCDTRMKYHHYQLKHVEQQTKNPNKKLIHPTIINEMFLFR